MARCDYPGCKRGASVTIKRKGKRLTVCAGRGGHVAWAFRLTETPDAVADKQADDEEEGPLVGNDDLPFLDPT